MKQKNRKDFYPGYLRRNSSFYKKKSSKNKKLLLKLGVCFFLILICLAIIFIIIRLFLVKLELPYYRVKPGETLLSLSLKFKKTIKELAQLNNIAIENRLPLGKVLIIPQIITPGITHTTQLKKETLSQISAIYGITQKSLVKINDINSHIIHKGTILHLTQTRPEQYTVKEHESLEDIAYRFGISDNQIVQYNALNNMRVHTGQVLNLYKNNFLDFNNLPIEMISLNSKMQFKKTLFFRFLDIFSSKNNNTFSKNTVKKLSLKNSSYKEFPAIQENIFTSEQKFIANSELKYSSKSSLSIYQDFHLAQKKIRRFYREIESLSSLGKQLKGYKIIIDPGHGGYDPGAVVKRVYEQKESYLIEDEYNYDMALRLCRLFKRHGADVFLTIISPNNSIRNKEGLTEFFNEKNEVYNNSSVNFRPIGGSTGITERLKIGKLFFRGIKENKSIWISIHHDSSPYSPEGLIAVYSNPHPLTIRLADHIIRSRNYGKILKEEYFILKKNPSPAAVLIEVRNPALGEDKYMISPELREFDALSICNGILGYAGSLSG